MTLTVELDLDVFPLDLHGGIQVCMSVRSAVRVRRTDPHRDNVKTSVVILYGYQGAVEFSDFVALKFCTLPLEFGTLKTCPPRSLCTEILHPVPDTINSLHRK